MRFRGGTNYKVWRLVSVAYRPPNSYIYSQISVRRLKYTYRGIHIRGMYLLVREAKCTSKLFCAKLCLLINRIGVFSISSLTRWNEKRMYSYIWRIANDLVSEKLFQWKKSFFMIQTVDMAFERGYILWLLKFYSVLDIFFRTNKTR